MLYFTLSLLTLYRTYSQESLFIISVKYKHLLSHRRIFRLLLVSQIYVTPMF